MSSHDTKLKTFWYYILVFILLCVSGNPILDALETKYTYVILAVALIILSFGLKYTIKFRRWVVYLCILYTCQFVVLQDFSINASLNFLCKFISAYIIVTMVGTKFRHIYFNILFFISAISLVCFFTQFTGGIEIGRNLNVLVYNSLRTGFDRNSGMFWEPGAFQGYIMLAFLMYFDDLIELLKNNKIKVAVLIIALITTKSTTGYVTFGVLIVFYTLTSNLQKVLKILIVAGLSFGCVSVYYANEFLSEKIENEYQEASQQKQGTASWSRMGSLLVDLDNISRHPIIGNGYSMESKYGRLAQYMGGAGNGFSGSINTYGCVIIALYILALCKSAPSNNHMHKLLFAFLIVLLCNGEYFLNYPLFWSIIFIQYPKKKELIN